MSWNVEFGCLFIFFPPFFLSPHYTNCYKCIPSFPFSSCLVLDGGGGGDAVVVVVVILLLLAPIPPPPPPQWGAEDAQIKVPSGANTELKRSPFKAWSRSVDSHTCYAYCQGILPCLFLPFQSIHLHFSNASPDFSCVCCC